MFMIWRYRHERRVGRLLAAEKRQEEKAEKTWQKHHAGREILLSVCQILRRLWAKACAEAPHSLRVGKQADIRGAGIDRDQHHEHGPDAVHVNHEMARILQADAQETYEQTHTREEWMERIGRNYKL